MASKIFNGMGREWRYLKRSTDGAEKKGLSRPCPKLSGATGDVRKILTICPLFYRISCNCNRMSGNEMPT